MKNRKNNSNYVIITPARNEDAFIGNTIRSVVSQTIRPLRWVIVNDGSIDRTIEIVEPFLRKYTFIKSVNLEREGGRDFGRKAIAFGRGLAEMQGLDYDFIGNLDADISLEPNYYKRILQEFDGDPRLGIVGGSIYTKIGKSFSTSDKTLDSVAGAVQLFRRACFEDVGGYPRLELGGIDAVAEIRAKMLGWKIRKLLDLKVIEHRRTGTAQARPVIAKFREGKRFYSLGYCPLFYISRCIYRFKDPPLVIGSIAALYGFMQSLIKQHNIPLPTDLITYLRREQRQQLRELLWRGLKPKN